MMWNKGKVWTVHGGQNEEAPVAGPPPVTGRKRRYGMLLLTMLNVSILCGAVIMPGRKKSDQSHDAVAAVVPATQGPAVEPEPEPVRVAQAPTPKPEAVSDPVIPAPAVEPPAEPASNVRTRMAQALAVEPEPEPARVAQAPAVEPDPVPQRRDWIAEVRSTHQPWSVVQAAEAAGVSHCELVELQGLAAGFSPAEARRNREYIEENDARIARCPKCVPTRREALRRSPAYTPGRGYNG